MRIGIWQTQGSIGDPAGNLAQLAAMLPAAAAAGVELLVLPELWTTGYNAADAVRRFAESADGPTLAAVSALARRFGTGIAYGYPERCADIVYNSALLVGSDGAPLRNYRKLHLWGDFERSLFVPGPLPEPPVEYAGWRIALAICYDTEFPELLRRYALEGAELVLAPTALAAGGEAIPDLIVPVRALENHLFIAFANRCGVEAGLTYQGGSCIVDPFGTRLAGAAAGEALIVADLDRDALGKARSRTPYLADRRTDLLPD